MENSETDIESAVRRIAADEGIRRSEGLTIHPSVDLDQLPRELYATHRSASLMEGWRPSPVVWQQQPNSIRNIWRRMATALDGRPRVRTTLEPHE